MPSTNVVTPSYSPAQLTRYYTRGQPVFHCGDPVTGLWSVTSGLVRLVRLTEAGRGITVRLAGPGDVLEPNILRGGSGCSADALCVTERVVLSYTPRCALLRTERETLLTLLAQLARQLTSAETQVTLSTCSTDERVVWLFGWLTPRFGRRCPDGWTELTLPLTHEDVAALVNATRVTVSYVFAQLRTEGKLKGSRGRYFIDATLWNTPHTPEHRSADSGKRSVRT